MFKFDECCADGDDVLGSIDEMCSYFGFGGRCCHDVVENVADGVDGTVEEWRLAGWRLWDVVWVFAEE